MIERRAEPQQAGQNIDDGDSGPTSKLEILRSTLVELLHDHVAESAEWRLGQSITAVEQDSQAVAVTTDYGTHLSADALIIAEGAGSMTRHRVLPQGIALKRLGCAMAFATIPSTVDDDRW